MPGTVVESYLPLAAGCGETWIGPVKVAWLAPDVARTAAPRLATANALHLGGECSWSAAEELRELVGNHRLARTIAGVHGVPVEVFTDPPVLSDLIGWYLLTGMDKSAARLRISAGEDGVVPFGVDAVGLGPQMPKILHSSRQRPNYGNWTGQSIVADPFYNDDGAAASMSYVPLPAGTKILRAYDDVPMAGLGAKSTPIAGSPAGPAARKMAVILT